MGAIGDVLMVVPAAWALHSAGWSVDWIIGKSAAPILRCYSWINAVVVDDAALFTGGVMGRAGAMTQVWSRLMGQKYDLCATLYYDARYRALTLPVRAKRNVALDRRMRDRLLLPGRHHTDEFARILLGQADGCKDVSLSPVAPDALPPSPLPMPEAGRARIAIIPGGSSNMLRQQTLRRWPVGFYAELSKRLLGAGMEVVMVGGPDDAWVRSDFAGLNVTDLIGKVTLPEVVAMCDTCELVVSHDTGPMHLAGVSKAGLLCLFGPTNPANFMPRRAGVEAIWGGEGFACRPCHDGVSFAPCLDNGCMQQISTGMVFAQVQRMLLARAEGRAGMYRVHFPSEFVTGDV